MSDITVTINPPNSTSVTIGNAISPHASTHAVGGSDSLSAYYYPQGNPSGYATSGDFATTGYVGNVSGAIVSQISFQQDVVFITGSQNISGAKNFYSRPTVNGTGILLSGEASSQSTGYLTGYVSKLESGVFYPINNPSGYITGVNLASYATIAYTTGVSGHLQGQVSTLNAQTGSYVTGSVVRTSQTGSFITQSQTGNFYAASNPSGYITGVNLSTYASISYVTGVSGFLQNEISTLQSSTGSYVTGNIVRPSQTGQFLTGETDPIFSSSVAFQINSTLTGNWTTSYNENITGIDVAGSTTKTITLYQRNGGNISASFTDSQGTGAGADFYIYSGSFNSSNGNLILNRTGDNGIVTISLDGRYSTIDSTTGISGYLQNQISAINIVPLQNATGNLNTRVLSLESQTGNYVTGNVVRPSDTGIFYPTSNPSGYITGVNLSNYATVSNLTGTSGFLQTQISSLTSQTGSYITNSQTGAFYPRSNPSGYITGVDLSSYQTISSSTGISGFLQSQINAIDLTPLRTATGNLNTRVLSIENQTGNFVLKNTTGAFITTGAADARFYPLSSNPSSYLVASDIASLASTGYVTGISGYLQSEINILNSTTGLLYPRSNPSGYITGVDLSSYALQNSVNAINSQSGQWITGYNKSITGLSFAGTDTKTLTLYSQDGASLSANFTDLQGTGGSASNVVYLTGDQNISGVKNFYSRPTVGSTGVILSGEFIPIIKEVYIDAGAMLTGISGATPSTISISNSGIVYDCFNFDPALTGYAQFKLKLADYNLGSIRAKFDWTTSGTGGGVVWGIQGIALNDSGSLSSSWGSPQEVFDTFITGTGLHQSSGTSNITFGGSPQSNSLLCFQIYRNVFNVADTLAVNANLLGIKLQYTGASISSW